MQMPNSREAVILSLLINGEKYGREIRDEYQRRTGEELPLGSLYTSLQRMNAKGFLKTRMGESAAERGGNRRKYYKLSANGHQAANAFEVRVNAIAGARHA
jgi:DNA-binding PadR family transcriptional regulator